MVLWEKIFIKVLNDFFALIYEIFQFVVLKHLALPH